MRVAEPDENEVLVMDMGMGEKKEKNEKKVESLRIASLMLFEV